MWVITCKEWNYIWDGEVIQVCFQSKHFYRTESLEKTWESKLSKLKKTILWWIISLSSVFLLKTTTTPRGHATHVTKYFWYLKMKSTSYQKSADLTCSAWIKIIMFRQTEWTHFLNSTLTMSLKCPSFKMLLVCITLLICLSGLSCPIYV